ncbi:nitroreductase/quinone reductase family protein [Micromonospora peucetia]|uniref:Deazaflavin-dependent oxidoreductase, nitroreductase family n=1 Tax=Micromonospora peucetia TaxID=47871 RepID=A0A1C6VUH3_9ACTN|nr:nitroreductase/quinone reductase family protein [Micromonospora peucetia]SCL69872.1 deazaflavin-dependent oxidoreductase, nitroreductase family [Micromonospora peucetia]
MSRGDRIGAETRSFASYGRSWLVIIRGPRGMAFDRFLVRRTGFSLVSLQYALAGRFPYNPTLLLTTVGRRSGQLRDAALPYVPHGTDLVVVGSKGGGPTDPAWVVNARHHELCWIVLRRKTIAVRARVTDGERDPELFAHVVAHKPNVGRYAERAAGFGRQIPLVVLSAVSGESLT